MFKYKFHNLYSPDDAISGVNKVEPMAKEDMITFMEDDTNDEIIDLDESKDKSKDKDKDKDDKKDDKKDEDEEVIEDEDEDEDKDELDEIEEELKEPTDEDLELVTPVKRREILAKYPQLFKEFPYLEKAYYREQKFTELFPTIEDATNASDAVQTLDALDADLSEGKTETILTGLKKENPEAFNRVVDDYLETLGRIDEKAYYHVIGNIGKQIIVSMVKEADASKNDELKKAAALLNQYLFATSEYTPPTKLSKPESEKKDDSIDKERQDWIKERFQSEITDLHRKIGNSLKNTVDANIDKNKVMTDFVRKHATNEVMANLNRTLKSDKRFQDILTRLHTDVVKTKFSEESLNRVKSAWLSKAKAVLPTLIKQARLEALKGMNKKIVKENDEVEDDDKDEEKERSHRSTPKIGNKDKKGEVPSGMSTFDYLNS